MSELTAAMREQAATLRRLFSPMTPRYDFQNRLFSLGLDMGWRRVLVEGIRSGSTTNTGSTGVLLDLAAGTLDVSQLLLRRFPHHRVVACDLCAPMLRHGLDHKISDAERSRLLLVATDGRALPLPDASVDAVTLAFGIRNMIPHTAALAEIRRVLVPGGQLHVLELAPLTLPLLGPLYHWHLETIMPRLAAALGGSADAFRYLSHTIRDFPLPPAFARDLDAAGLRPIAWTPVACGIAHIHRAEKLKEKLVGEGK